MFRLAAFDLVGTLVDARLFQRARLIRVDFNEGWSDAATESGFDSNFDYSKVFRLWLERWLERDPAEPIYRRFQKSLLKNTPRYLYPDVGPALTQLHGLGVRLGFVTDGSAGVEGQMIEKILRGYKIASGECVIVTGEMVGSTKADGEPFSELVAQATRFGISREEVIFVGDTPGKDIKGAQAKGLTTALNVREGPPSAEASAYVADYQVRSLGELTDLIKDLPQS